MRVSSSTFPDNFLYQTNLLQAQQTQLQQEATTGLKLSLPEDNPSAPTIMRHLRYQDARYPVAGIKSPADGVLIFQTTDFHDLCLPNTSLRSAAVP